MYGVKDGKSWREGRDQLSLFQCLGEHYVQSISYTGVSSEILYVQRYRIYLTPCELLLVLLLHGGGILAVQQYSLHLNAHRYSRYLGLHFGGRSIKLCVVFTWTLAKCAFRFHLLERAVAMQRFAVQIFVWITSWLTVHSVLCIHRPFWKKNKGKYLKPGILRIFRWRIIKWVLTVWLHQHFFVFK